MCFSPNIIRRDQIRKSDMSGACGTYGESRGEYRVMVVRPDGKGPLGKH